MIGPGLKSYNTRQIKNLQLETLKRPAPSSQTFVAVNALTLGVVVLMGIIELGR